MSEKYIVPPQYRSEQMLVAAAKGEEPAYNRAAILGSGHDDAQCLLGARLAFGGGAQLGRGHLGVAGDEPQGLVEVMGDTRSELTQRP